MSDFIQKPGWKAIFLLIALPIISIGNVHAQQNESPLLAGAMARWLESHWGLPPWFIILIIAPVFVTLLSFLLRRLVLGVALYFEKGPRPRKIWRRLSLYLAIILALLSLFWIWESRGEYLAEDLSSLTGRNMADLLPYIIGIRRAIMATLILAFLIFLLLRGFNVVLSKLKIRAEKSEEGRFYRLMRLTSGRMYNLLVHGLRFIRFVIFVVLFYFYIPLMLSFFPATASFAREIMPYVTNPTFKVLNAIGGYIPELITVILIIVVVRYFMKLLKNFFAVIGSEKIKIRGFDPEWAEQTYRLLRIFIILAGIMACYPFLPGSGSDMFKGFSVFVGAVITLGSTSAVNNIVSGIVLTYTGAFRLGDRVRIGDLLGDVIEKKLFVTRVRTIKNEIVTVPNGKVLGNSIFNLSTAAQTEGLSVNASAGISYDIDWRKVHGLMIKAALQTDGILQDPEPHVLVTNLGNFSVTYKLIAYTNDPKQVALIETQLRRKLLDLFKAEGIEIMSPSVTTIRESTSPMIPSDDDSRPVPFTGRKKKT